MKYLIALMLFSASVAEGVAYRIVTEKTQVVFIAKGNPGFLKITGEHAAARGALENKDSNWSGFVEVDLTGLKTGIDLRDEHMHEKYLETQKYPKAKLILSQVEVDGDACQFKGVLTIKDKEAPVSGTCEIGKLTDKEFEGSMEMEFELEKYPVGVPSYLGITVADVVKIEASFRAESVSE